MSSNVSIKLLNIPGGPWYEDHHKEKETPEFNLWWQEFYGDPEDYAEVDQDEYWIRKGFALMGWLARPIA